MKRCMTRYIVTLVALLFGTAMGGGLASGDGWIASSAMSGRMVVDTRTGKGTLATDHAEDIAPTAACGTATRERRPRWR